MGLARGLSALPAVAGGAWPSTTAEGYSHVGVVIDFPTPVNEKENTTALRGGRIESATDLIGRQVFSMGMKENRKACTGAPIGDWLRYTMRTLRNLCGRCRHGLGFTRICESGPSDNLFLTLGSRH